MKTFEYSTRDYVPSVDLTTLGKTFDTLEQGHKEAVKAASDLEVAVANLDMNEAEDGFKQQLINEIKTTIDENTIYGNSYGALDDLILKSGNIASDGRVIGRLRSQAAKKEFDTKVDNMSMSEGMKAMYKELNPYYYKDGDIDTKTGRVLPGETWKPIDKPVNTVPVADIQKHALSIAAKESGGGQTVYFLDKNGKPTLDPSQSEDGTMYKQVGSTYERLPADKIRRAYKIAIESIPGAEDSLKQDYKYAEWEREKLVKNNEREGKDIAPYVQGLTDKNGHIYTYEQWLDNKINGFADVAAYNNVHSTVNYGTALQNKRAAQKAAADKAASGLGVGADGTRNGGFGTHIIGTKEVESNSLAGTINAKRAANENGLGIVKKWMAKTYQNADSISDVFNDLYGKGLAKTPQEAANYFIKRYGDRMSQNEKVQLVNSFNGYSIADAQYNELIKAAGKDKDKVLFNADVANGTFTNNNTYSKGIIWNLNNFYKNHDKAEYEVGKDILDQIKTQYGVQSYVDLMNMGFKITKKDEETYNVSIDANNRNLLPRFSSELKKADDVVAGNIWSGIKRGFGYISKSNYKLANKISSNDDKYINGLRSSYDNATKNAENIEEQIGVAKGYITYHGTDASSYGELYLRENAAALGLSENDLQTAIKRQNGQLDLMFANGNFDSGLIEEPDDGGIFDRKTNNTQEVKVLLQKMYANDTWAKQIKREVTMPDGYKAGQPKSYTLTFTVPKGAETEHYKEGQHCRFVVKGTIEEEYNYDPSFNPNILASNSLITSRATGSNITNLGYNPDFGDTRLINKNDGTYDVSFMNKKNNLSYDQAKQYISIFNTLAQLKSQYRAGIYHDSPEHVVQLYNSVEVIANNLATITNTNPNDVAIMITNYFNNEE